MPFKKKLGLLTGLVCFLGAPLVQAAAPVPSVVGTTWALTGKFKGRVSAKCQVGRAVSAPIAGRNVLSARISFDDGDVPGDNEGTFSWTDEFFSIKQISGHWEQSGSKLELEFDHWYDSPMAALAFALAGVPANYDFSQAGIDGSAGFKITKLKVSGTINRKGKRIKVAEGIGFKVDAAAAGFGGANALLFPTSLNN
ncbi:hypothetical protein [Methylomicrobium agile]|uniref:hypothetical protein n=1 Tax=Methylomicrobium agile TaxID=39774 RepID=UPI0004DEFB5C|nr:hypothetical protein [Methylomicrobium agile]